MFSYLSSFIGPSGNGLNLFLLTFPITLVCVHIFLRKSVYSIPQKAGVYLFFLFLMIDIGLVFFPFPDMSHDFCATREAVTHWRWIPFQFISDIQKNITDKHLTGWSTIWYNESFLQVLFNFLFLVPLGVLGNAIFRWKLLRLSLIILIITIYFEIMQGTALFGFFPCSYRFFDIDDIFLNVSGAILGWSLVNPFRKIIARWMKEKENRIEKNSHFSRRLTAYIIDICIAKFFLSSSFLISLFLDKNIFLQKVGESLSDGLAYFIYFVLIAYLWHGRTVGKYLLGLKITSTEEKRPSLLQLFNRSLMIIFLLPIINFTYQSVQILGNQEISVPYIITMIYYFVIFLLIPITIELSQDGRGWHDKLGKTKVESKETGLYKIYLKVKNKD